MKIDRVTLTTQIADCNEPHAPALGLSIVRAKDGISITPEGFGHNEMEDGPPILIEIHEGRLRVLVWPNINSADPQIIDMENARESKRRD